MLTYTAFTRRLTQWLWLGASLAACAPTEPTGGTRYDPPPEYALWWRQVEACSSRTSRLSAVDWYTMPGPRFSVPDHPKPVAGYWASGGLIYIAEAYQLEPWVIRHEMLHQLLGSGGHWQLAWAACEMPHGVWVSPIVARETKRESKLDILQR